MSTSTYLIFLTGRKSHYQLPKRPKEGIYRIFYSINLCNEYKMNKSKTLIDMKTTP